MNISHAQWDALVALLGKHEPLDDDWQDAAHEQAGDGGNFNDTLEQGIDLGERSLAADVRDILGIEVTE